MAFTPNSNLITDPNVLLRDQQHASKMFAVDQFRLAPKQKFLFHVAFNINEAALRTIDLKQRHSTEINMLVKSTDLPKFTVNTELLNQYNRKKAVQYSHKPDPITIKFHDDNMGLINQLWQNYYSYYYADPVSADINGAYGRNATRKSDFITGSYGLDNSSTVPFFNYIKIYQMARHEFVCYHLQNPLITSWQHGGVSYSENSTNEQTMTLQYEAVSYSSGDMLTELPEGFGDEHYDVSPSPLAGDFTQTSSSPSFAKGLNLAGSAESFLNSVITQVNTAQNTKTPTGSGSPSSSSAQQTLNGLQGFSFPTK